MKKYVLDTNLYIQAFRSRKAGEELAAFYRTFTPSTYLSSIVVHELMVGANTPAKARQIRAEITEPLKRVGRLITPSHNAWEDAGEAIAKMARKERRDLRTVPKSLVHDYILAASCREAGVTLVTDNIDDFALIRSYLRFDYEAPWPA